MILTYQHQLVDGSFPGSHTPQTLLGWLPPSNSQSFSCNARLVQMHLGNWAVLATLKARMNASWPFSNTSTTVRLGLDTLCTMFNTHLPPHDTTRTVYSPHRTMSYIDTDVLWYACSTAALEISSITTYIVCNSPASLEG